MLRKLLKYDLKSVWRLWWIVAVTLPFFAVVGGISYRILYVASGIKGLIGVILSLMSGLAEMACMMGFAAAAIVTSILVFFRFYKNLFSDEGYLTFTLPASRRTIFLSKTLNAVIWFTAYGLLLIGCLFVVALIAPVPESGEVVNLIVFESLDTLFEFFADIGWGGWIAVYVVEFLLLLIAGQFFSICLVQLCITIGSVIAKKHKILASIGIYYGMSIAMSFLTQILSVIFIFAMASGLDFYLSVNALTYPVVALVFLVLFFILASIGAVCYCLTQWLIDRKLNLA